MSTEQTVAIKKVISPEEILDSQSIKIAGTLLFVFFLFIMTAIVGCFLGILYNISFDWFEGDKMSFGNCIGKAVLWGFYLDLLALAFLYSKQFFHVFVGGFFGIIAAAMLGIAYILLRIAVEAYQIADLSRILEYLNK